MFTSGYELLTALTNIVIFVLSLCFFIKTKKENFKLFYFLLFIDGAMGTIIHGFVMKDELKNIFWLILSFFFTFTVNDILLLFFNKVKKISKTANFVILIVLSLVLYCIFVVEFFINIDFLNTFIIYSLIVLILCLLISIYFVFVKNSENDVWYLFGIIFQFIGGIFLMNKQFHLWLLDKNGLYHLCMCMTLILFYIGNKEYNNLPHKKTS